MREEGIVKSIKNGNVIVETVPPEGCKGCASCGAASPRAISLNLSEFKDIKEGDCVTIDVQETAMMKVYILLYAIPLAVFVLSILLTYVLFREPLWSFISALLATCFVYVYVGRYVKGRSEFSPKICKIKHGQ